jgi:hypothetical protein
MNDECEATDDSDNSYVAPSLTYMGSLREAIASEFSY